MRLGFARKPRPKENGATDRSRNVSSSREISPEPPKCSYPDVNSTVLGSIVPSFRNFTTFSSQVLKLYRDFWRLVYRLPVEDQENAKTKLRTRFRRASYVKGQKHILQILKNARSELEHWRGLVDSLEIKRSRPLECSKGPERTQPKQPRFQDLTKLMYDSESRTFKTDPNSPPQEPVDALTTTSPVERPQDRERISWKVREFYLQRANQHAGHAIQGLANESSSKSSQFSSVSLFTDNPSEFAWEDVRKAVNNAIPFVRAVGSVGYLHEPSLFKPRRELLRRKRSYGWNIMNQRTATGLRGFEH